MWFQSFIVTLAAFSILEIDSSTTTNKNQKSKVCSDDNETFGSLDDLHKLDLSETQKSDLAKIKKIRDILIKILKIPSNVAKLVNHSLLDKIVHLITDNTWHGTNANVNNFVKIVDSLKPKLF